MRYLGITGLVLTAAFALSAITASSALALPVLCLPTVEKEWGNFNEGCTAEGAKQGFVRGMILALGDKVGEGEYCLMVLPGLRTGVKGWTTLEGCRKKEAGIVETGAVFTRVKDKVEENTAGTAKSEFRVLPSSLKIAGFFGESTIGVGAAESITCEKGADGGTITSMDTIGKVAIAFAGCKAHNEKSETCTIKSPGASEGEIVTNTLKGELGKVKSTSEAASQVGLLFSPETGSRIATFATTPCSVESGLFGTVAAEANPVSVKVSDGEFAFELASTNKQAIKEITVLAGVTKPELEAFGRIATLQAIDEVEFEGSVEIA